MDRWWDCEEIDEMIARLLRAGLGDKRTRGGKRKGAGRKPEGKAPYTVTPPERSKKRESNFSSLLDRLLAKWLA
jgi:hypothetical protein